MMKTWLYCACALALALMVFPAAAQDEGAGAKSTVALEDDIDRLSYSVGYQVGKSLQDLPDIDLDVFTAAIKDTLEDKQPALNDQEMQEAIMAVMQQVQEQQQKRAQEQQAKAQEEGAKREASNQEWLAANGKKEGVKTTASGLQYKVIKDGEGESPKATDTVTVNYRGTLLDGTEFDSSYERGQPATFPLNQVIKGWTEGLQLMKPGAKYEFYIPSKLAYGDQFRPGSPIPPNSVLIFEVELLNVEKSADGGEIVLEN